MITYKLISDDILHYSTLTNIKNRKHEWILKVESKSVAKKCKCVNRQLFLELIYCVSNTSTCLTLKFEVMIINQYYFTQFYNYLHVLLAHQCTMTYSLGNTELF